VLIAHAIAADGGEVVRRVEKGDGESAGQAIEVGLTFLAVALEQELGNASRRSPRGGFDRRWREVVEAAPAAQERVSRSGALSQAVADKSQASEL